MMAHLHSDLAAILYESLIQQIDSNCWTQAYMDSRGDQSGRVEKFRAILTSGAIQCLERPTESIDTVEKIFETGQDPTQTSPIWYGMIFRIYPDKTHSVEYLYDPNCMEKFDFES